MNCDRCPNHKGHSYSHGKKLTVTCDYKDKHESKEINIVIF